MRRPARSGAAICRLVRRATRLTPTTYSMDGAEIFSFPWPRFREPVRGSLAASGKQLSDIDLFVFPSGTRHMLEHSPGQTQDPARAILHLLKALRNTVSSTIPITLHEAVRDGTLRSRSLGDAGRLRRRYSWAATLVRWR